MIGGTPVARGFCWCVGGADALTGLALLLRPTWVTSALGVDAPAETVFLRFVGVFVGSVGLAYLYPYLLRSRSERAARLRAMLEWTAGIRLAVAVFVTLAVGAGSLAAPWLLVAGFDGAVAVTQVVLLGRGRFADAR